MPFLSQDSTTPAASRVAELEKAFSEFTATSLQLETAYRELEQRAAMLSDALATAQDERLAHLKEKERLADRLQGLLTTLPAAVVVLDATGRIEECNPGAELLLGEQLTGTAWNDIVSQRFAREGDGAGEFLLKNGRLVTLATRKLEQGRILLLTDVTETRRLQQSLARNQRLTAMGQMNARLAHQLRTPLATAVLYTSQLRGQDHSERGQRYTTRILNSLKLLERMVNDMLRFAGGSCADNHEPIAVNELLAEVAAHLEGQLHDDIELEFGAPPGLLINGDREALVGALLNLASNAIDHGESPLKLRLDADRRDDLLSLRVSDNGPGISAADKERIFEPFYTTRPQGTGLGLAVVAAVARGHAGSVAVTDAPEGGACFEILLPALNHNAMRSGNNALALRSLLEEPA